MTDPRPPHSTPRRHDIDALRALAFALVIVYHVAMYYVADWHWHIKSPHAVEWLQAPMRALNLWRMDLVFLVSGLALGLVRRGQTVPGLVRLRSGRLLLPLAFGMAVVVPYQPYAQGVANGLIAPGFGAFLLRYFSGGPWPAGAFDGWEAGVTWNHLWYLAYLWAYTMVLALLLPWLESARGQRLRRAFTGLRGLALFAVPVLPLALYSLLLWRHFPPTHDLIHDAWLHAVYFTLFLYGYWIGLDAGLWAELVRLRWRTLGAALALLVLFTALRGLAVQQGGWPARTAMRMLADLYLWSMLLAILGWAHHRLNQPWRWLPWAQEAVYPWYVLHQTAIIVLAVALARWQLGPVLEPLVLLAGTVLACWAVTAVVQRLGWLRPLFGLPRAGSGKHLRPTEPPLGSPQMPYRRDTAALAPPKTMESTPPDIAGLSPLRAATEADAPALAALWRRAWASANTSVADVAPLAHWLERVRAEFGPPHLALVGERDGAIVAFMVLDVEGAHLHQLFVDPLAQGHGIGAGLVARVCALCPAGWSLHVASTNLGARRFYARCGLGEHGHDRHPATGRERVLCRWPAQAARLSDQASAASMSPASFFGASCGA